MTKVIICVKHNGVEYLSAVKEISEKELNEAKEMLYNAVSGHMDGFVMDCEGHELYLPMPILLNSIVSLIYEKE